MSEEDISEANYPGISYYIGILHSPEYFSVIVTSLGELLLMSHNNTFTTSRKVWEKSSLSLKSVNSDLISCESAEIHLNVLLTLL